MSTHADDIRWTDEAICASVDPELFYPQSWQDPRAAKQVCATCPVRRPCLEEGLTDDFGIFAGLVVEQRAELRRIINKHPDLRDTVLDYAAKHMHIPTTTLTR